MRSTVVVANAAHQKQTTPHVRRSEPLSCGIGTKKPPVIGDTVNTGHSLPRVLMSERNGQR